MAASVLAAAPLAAQPGLALGGIAVSGYAAASVASDGIERSAAWGAAELTPDGATVRALSVDSPVRIASVSKLAVAIALHRLADQGLLTLDDEASLHLGWTLRNPAHPDRPITIRQLLRHHSSLSDRGGYLFPLGVRLKDQIGPENFAMAAPDGAFDYANLGYVVLGEVIESVTGERFDIAMRRLLLQPLGIAGCFNWSGCEEGQAAAGAVLYRKSTDYGQTWKPDGPWIAQVDAERPQARCPVLLSDGAACDLSAYVPGTHGGLFSPQGGLRISVSDLLKLGKVLLGQRPGFLSAQSLDSLFTAVAVKGAGAGQETDSGLMQSWSQGGLHCFSGTGKAGGDQPTAPVPMAGCGHLGQAYGLFSGLIVDAEGGTIMAYAITGTAEKPPVGAHSRFRSVEEEVLRGLGAGLQKAASQP